MTAQTLGPYTLGERLGTLPFGELVEATQSGRSTPLALLLLADDLAGDLRFRGLLRRAASTIEGMRRAGVSRLVEVGEHGSTVFLTYERPAGRSLAASLAVGESYGPDRVVEIVGSLAATLDAVHQRGLVHGLLGPASIFVDDVGGVSIVGLGLLAAVDEAGLGDALGGRVNLSYVAPEQSDGRHAVPLGRQLRARRARVYPPDRVAAGRADRRPRAAGIDRLPARRSVRRDRRRVAAPDRPAAGTAVPELHRLRSGPRRRPGCPAAGRRA